MLPKNRFGQNIGIYRIFRKKQILLKILWFVKNSKIWPKIDDLFRNVIDCNAVWSGQNWKRRNFRSAANFSWQSKQIEVTKIGPRKWVPIPRTGSQRCLHSEVKIGSRIILTILLTKKPLKSEKCNRNWWKMKNSRHHFHIRFKNDGVQRIIIKTRA